MDLRAASEARPNPGYAAVFVDAGGPASRRPFDYLIPEDLRDKVGLGSLVIVPFGRRYLRGVVADLLDTPSVPEPKPIRELYRSAGLADRHAPELASFVSARYACSPIEAYRAILPPAIAGRTSRAWTAGEVEPPAPGALPAGLEEVYGLVRAYGSATLAQVAATLSLDRIAVLDRIRRLQREGLLEPEAAFRGPVAARGETLYAAAPGVDTHLDELNRAPRQAAVLKKLAAAGRALRIVDLDGPRAANQAAVKALVARGMINEAGSRDRPTAPRPLAGLGGRDGPIELTEGQSVAVRRVMAALERGEAAEFLLLGVTGSGKTEVYLRCIAEVLKAGGQALVLVPEIALTPQAATRFEDRFPGQVALMHSKLSAGERTHAWRQLAAGKAAIAVGPRSAVFAPLPTLRLIVVDEEHESSYKQEDIPRYDAREVARRRASLCGAIVLSGSATPSLEAYHRATRDASRGGADDAAPQLELLQLPERVDGKQLPEVIMVDMREELESGNRSVLSRRLQTELAARVERSEQSILFLNRRGMATFVLCRECGYVARCPHCDVSLVYHGSEQTLRCHHCGYQEEPPSVCPSCHGTRIRYFGSGTERVEAQVKEVFPGARVGRLDSDVAARRGRVEQILGDFSLGNLDILIGTQMIGKGLDIPNVTLVGVIAADTSLNFPDFRAAERTFSLVTQVAGRAGRGGRPGLVIVQTYSPEHYSLRYAKNHDYLGFCCEELVHRRELGYPPHSHIGLIRISGEDEKATSAAAEESRFLLQELLTGQPSTSMLGPSPAPLYRLQGRYRWNIVLKDTDPRRLAAACSAGLDVLMAAIGPTLRVSADVDPQAML